MTFGSFDQLTATGGPPNKQPKPRTYQGTSHGIFIDCLRGQSFDRDPIKPGLRPPPPRPDTARLPYRASGNNNVPPNDTLPSTPLPYHAYHRPCAMISQDYRLLRGRTEVTLSGTTEPGPVLPCAYRHASRACSRRGRWRRGGQEKTQRLVTRAVLAARQ